MDGLSETLRKARKAKHLTQQQAADALGVHRTSYTKYETGQTQPPLEIFARLLVLLDIPAETLLR